MDANTSSVNTFGPSPKMFFVIVIVEASFWILGYIAVDKPVCIPLALKLDIEVHFPLNYATFHAA